MTLYYNFNKETTHISHANHANFKYQSYSQVNIQKYTIKDFIVFQKK